MPEEEMTTENVEKQAKQSEGLLVSEDMYVSSVVHIGTEQKSGDMRDFIIKTRSDGLHIIDIEQTDKRIRLAAKLLASYEPSKVILVATRQYAQKPNKAMASALGAQHITGRFMPGSLTNPRAKQYLEPEMMFVADPAADTQAMREAINTNIPIVGICHTNNDLKFVDLAIPGNNKGRASLALIYWLLTRETLKNMGKIKSDEEFTLTVDDFQAEI
ncbi:MAG: 30S ribosomal protein S2 [Candidatus Thermoplasmatota archaeon]|nr:30S ribosomal protein S2 [Candidatus Thermoplasmatota archaeon]